MKTRKTLQPLVLALIAAVTATAQDERFSALDLARLANTQPETPRFHVEEPLPPGWTLKDDIMVPPPGTGDAGFTITLWSGGVVQYTFDTNMSASDIAAAVVAMLDWESVTGVDFQPLTNVLKPWIHIRNSDEDDEPACSSPVGQTITAGYQIINITSGCLASYSIHHELAHTLGLYHEQSRPDRDSYVTINWDNIVGGPDCKAGAAACNFEIESAAYVYGAYDFDSVMHYGESFFSDGTGTTIDVLPAYAEWQVLIGQRDHLSYWDQTVMGCLYPEANWRFDDPDGFAWPIGTFFMPWNKDFDDAVADTPSGGTLFFIDGATFDWSGAITKAITIEAPLGGLVVN